MIAVVEFVEIGISVPGFVEVQDVDGIPVHRLHRNDLYFDHHVKAWHPGVTRAFDELLARHRPALVHVHHWVRLSCDLIEAARARGIPCVVTIHDFFTSCPRAFALTRSSIAKGG